MTQENSEKVSEEIMTLFNGTLATLASKQLTQMSLEEKQVTVGILTILAGWKLQIKNGA